jgi:hypothetical protein
VKAESKIWKWERLREIRASGMILPVFYGSEEYIRLNAFLMFFDEPMFGEVHKKIEELHTLIGKAD